MPFEGWRRRRGPGPDSGLDLPSGAGPARSRTGSTGCWPRESSTPPSTRPASAASSTTSAPPRGTACAAGPAADCPRSRCSSSRHSRPGCGGPGRRDGSRCCSTTCARQRTTAGPSAPSSTRRAPRGRRSRSGGTPAVRSGSSWRPRTTRPCCPCGHPDPRPARPGPPPSDRPAGRCGGTPPRSLLRSPWSGRGPGAGPARRAGRLGGPDRPLPAGSAGPVGTAAGDGAAARRRDDLRGLPGRRGPVGARADPPGLGAPRDHPGGR